MLDFHKKVLVLAPHTDDGELGCGATISNLIKKGADIYYVAFSSCKESLPAGSDPDMLVKELMQATHVLGIKRENIRVLDFPVRYFEQRRQDVLDTMINLDREINPNLVFSPSIHDIHQDHSTVAQECMRAFKKKTIFQYEVPWNNYTFNNQLFYCVDKAAVDKKVAAIHCYASQKNRSYAKESFIRSLLITHGVQIGESYAEVFETPHFIIKN